MARALAVVLAIAALSCASAPSGPPGASGAWGYVRLVPREGVHPGGGSGAYGDRRLADVRLVDYSRPGFVVVYAEGDAPGGRVEVVLRERPTGVRFEPSAVAVGAGGTIEIRNETGATQVLSAREHGRLESLAPGATASFPASGQGARGFSLLSGSETDALAFVAPGPFAVASDSGRFELSGLAPGRHRVVAWHPRFPSTARWVELSGGEMQRLDIEIGVDQPAEVEP